MGNPKVSAVITTYKREPEMVKRAVVSVLNQTYENLELIVVDDSPDSFAKRTDVRDMLKGIGDPRLHYVQHEQNMGGCAARNTGITHSDGEYIAFLDDDDEWCPEKLQFQMERMLSDDVGLVYCRAYIINEKTNERYEQQKKYYEGNVFDQLIITNFIGSTSFVLVKRSCFETIGMFDIELPSAQDFDMWLRIANFYKVAFVDKPLVNYYIHVGQRVSFNYANRLSALERIHEKYQDYYNEHKEVKNIRYLKIVRLYALNRQYKKMLKVYFQAIAASPLAIMKNIRGTTVMARAVIKSVRPISQSQPRY